MTLENEWESAVDFVDRLKAALVEEMAAIRETEFDKTGGFRAARLQSPMDDGISTMHLVEDVFVDRLGRVILPAKQPYKKVDRIAIDDGAFREVVRREPRYGGGVQTAWVCYLSSEEQE